MKLSYRTPSTMYIVTIAARISHSSLSSDARNASAAPWKLICTLSGRSELGLGRLDRLRRRRPATRRGARLNEIVAAGNWPMWLIDERRGFRSTICAIVDSRHLLRRLARHRRR